MVKIQTRMKSKPKGLENSGNNCFVNSTLQCIIHHPNLLNYFLTTKFTAKEKYSLVFQDFLKTYLSDENPKSPDKLIFKLKTKINILNGEMQDANEFLILLIDLFINEKVKEPKILTKDFLQKFSDSPILRLFSGLKNYISKCEICHQTINRYELFRILMISDDSVQKSVRKLFNLNQSTFTCDFCDKLTGKLQKVEVLFMPEILSVVVNRFLTMTEKNLAEITIDESLKVQGFKYELFAVVCHRGSLVSGHYTSFVKMESEWMFFDDGEVKNLKPNLVSSSVYCAFYTRTLL